MATLSRAHRPGSALCPHSPPLSQSFVAHQDPPSTFPRMMGIGIAECRADRCPSNDPVDQLAQRRSRAATSLDERVRTAHLVEQHHHELAPGLKPLAACLTRCCRPARAKFIRSLRANMCAGHRRRLPASTFGGTAHKHRKIGGSRRLILPERPEALSELLLGKRGLRIFSERCDQP